MFSNLACVFNVIHRFCIAPVFRYRFVFGWESGRLFLTPSVFNMAGFPPVPGPSRLASRWSLGGPTSDSDGSFRPAFENVRCTRYIIMKCKGCTWPYSAIPLGRCPPVLPLGQRVRELLVPTILVAAVVILTCLQLEQIQMERTPSLEIFMRRFASSPLIIRPALLCSEL